jgi:hypothetical protein
MILAKRTAITDSMRALPGLTLKPVYDDKEHKIVSIDSNYDEFIKSHSEINGKNFALKLLAEICRNVKAGNMIQADYYICGYRRMCDNFTGYIFLSAQIPFIVSIIRNGEWDFPFILIMQIFALALVIIFKMYSGSRVSVFVDNLYKNWYDKILNSDIIVINALHSGEQDKLLAAINSFEKINGERNATLSQTVRILSDKLDEFIILKKDEDGISPKTISVSLESGIEKLNETTASLINISDNSSESVSKLLNIAKENKEFFNTVNNNSHQIAELKKSMENYKEDALHKEMTHLENVVKTLDNNINNTYISIEKTVTSNTEKLIRGYENYFSICEKFSNLLEKNYETETIEALKKLDSNIASGFDKNEVNSGKLAEVIKAAAESNAKLSRSIYDLSQSSESLIKLFRINAAAIENQDEFFNFFRQIRSLTTFIDSESKTGDTYKALKDSEA